MGDEEQVFDFGSKKKKKSKDSHGEPMRLDAETQIESLGSQGVPRYLIEDVDLDHKPMACGCHSRWQDVLRLSFDIWKSNIYIYTYTHKYIYIYRYFYKYICT